MPVLRVFRKLYYSLLYVKRPLGIKKSSTQGPILKRIHQATLIQILTSRSNSTYRFEILMGFFFPSNPVDYRAHYQSIYVKQRKICSQLRFYFPITEP